ncbi:hypothetical protein [Psychrobacillus sp. NEAU-3TGS]|nr:hypothetical protein [Psychrobacillus sp. NEAU-3TGS]
MNGMTECFIFGNTNEEEIEYKRVLLVTVGKKLRKKCGYAKMMIIVV